MAFPISVTKRFSEESIDSMLKRLKRKLKNDGRILEMRKKEYFIKPSELKRMKKRRKKTSDGETLSEKRK